MAVTECKNCGKEFHHCGSCGDNGYSEYGFCKYECLITFRDRVCTHEDVECLECGQVLSVACTKPSCPFCGGAPALEENGCGGFWYYCCACACSTDVFENMELAWEAWVRRTGAPYAEPTKEVDK